MANEYIEIPQKKPVTQGEIFSLRAYLTQNPNEAIYVCNASETEFYALRLNHNGDVCCVVNGNNLRLLDWRDGKHYLTGASVMKTENFEQRTAAERAALMTSPSYRVTSFRSDVYANVQETIEPRTNTGHATRIEKPNSIDRLKKVLDIITGIDPKYKVFLNKQDPAAKATTSVTIRCKNPGNNPQIIGSLNALGCQVNITPQSLNISINYSRDEEKEAKTAGHKIIIIY